MDEKYMNDFQLYEEIYFDKDNICYNNNDLQLDLIDLKYI